MLQIKCKVRFRHTSQQAHIKDDKRLEVSRTTTVQWTEIL